jgi:hypothetical protein
MPKILRLFSEKNETLIKLDQQLQEIDDRYDRINSGGCAYFAIALQKKLRKAGFKPRLYIFSDGKLAEFVNRSPEPVSAARANEAGYSIAHILVRVGKYYIDSTGVIEDISTTRWSWYKGGFVKKEKEKVIKSWLKEEDRWNPAFSRRQLKDIFIDIKNIQL